MVPARLCECARWHRRRTSSRSRSTMEAESFRRGRYRNCSRPIAGVSGARPPIRRAASAWGYSSFRKSRRRMMAASSRNRPRRAAPRSPSSCQDPFRKGMPGRPARMPQGTRASTNGCGYVFERDALSSRWGVFVSESFRGREQTDESLRAERGKTDRELGKRREVVDDSADAVVQRAREAADEVLQSARDTADDKGPEPRTAQVVEERALADDALQSERASADESIRKEREERRRALANLLRLERDETDQHLLTERGTSDEALNTRDIFLAMVSHDLRTLLGGIAMNAEMLAREAGKPGDGNAVVLPRAATIQRLTARMNRLIGDLVDVASIEAGKLLVAPTEGDLRELIGEAVQMFEGSAEKPQIRLAPQLDGPPLRARFDHERLLQVLG